MPHGSPITSSVRTTLSTSPDKLNNTVNAPSCTHRWRATARHCKYARTREINRLHQSDVWISDVFTWAAEYTDRQVSQIVFFLQLCWTSCLPQFSSVGHSLKTRHVSVASYSFLEGQGSKGIWGATKTQIWGTVAYVTLKCWKQESRKTARCHAAVNFDTRTAFLLVFVCRLQRYRTAVQWLWIICQKVTSTRKNQSDRVFNAYKYIT